VSSEDILAAQMATRRVRLGSRMLAFTATPKAETMELFGTLPDPTRVAGPDNLPVPFHVYSMQQAIEEGFILDVLQTYTPYKLAFQLAHEGKRSTINGRTQRGDEGDYGLGSSSSAQHLAEGGDRGGAFPAKRGSVVARKSQGDGRCREPVGGGALAVGDQQVHRGAGLQGADTRGVLAEVNDKESGAEPFTETSFALNPNLKGRDIREAFATDEYQILLVANKFQTGFDQPLLCGMYVDKRLRWDPSGTDAFAVESGVQRQRHDVCGRFRERHGGNPRGV